MKFILFISISVLLVSCNNTLKQKDKNKEPGFTFRVIQLDRVPIINKNHVGSQDNKYGFEGGRIVEIEDTLHWFTAEISGDPQIVKMRIAHWKSKRGSDNWERVSTLYESSGEFTGKDTRAALWGPMPVFDSESELWNLFYVSYRAKPNTDSAWYLNHDGKIWRSVSTVKGLQGIYGPYAHDTLILEYGENSDSWEGLQGTDSFFPFQYKNNGMAFTEAPKPNLYPAGFGA
ncbi:MAG: hypothetical protein HC906_04200 [Bacteroidales bacterium]|nr:hypothetical protein [Bacteroidales bacterium]